MADREEGKAFTGYFINNSTGEMVGHAWRANRVGRFGRGSTREIKLKFGE